MMIRQHIFLLFLIVLAGCSGTSGITKLTQDADRAYAEGNYQEALTAYQKIIADYESKGEVTACPAYGKAGTSAIQLGDNELAMQYYEQAIFTPFADETVFVTLADHYRKIDNLSKEIDVLASCRSKFPKGENIDDVNLMLFEAYVASQNWDEAITVWPDISAQAAGNVDLLEGILKANKDLGNNENCNSIAQELLSLDPNNVPGMEWEAVRLYNKAEDRYQAEMKAYENKKTNSQYNKLLKAFEVVTADFKASLKYFKQLYEMNPSKEYISYLANIYARLDDKQKAEYYKSLLKSK